MKKENHLKQKQIVLVAGGTGGHVFPAQAVADLLIDKYKVSIITDERGTKFLKGSLLKAKKEVLSVRGFTGSINDKIQALICIVASFLRLFFKFFFEKPIIVIGFGGYPSVPAVLAAFFHHIPIVIHEQNAVIGRANKFLAKFATAVVLSFKNTVGTEEIVKYKLIYAGNPIRRQVLTLSENPHKKLDKSIFRILVIGGSQGASLFSNILPQSIKLLDSKVQENLYIYQQARLDLMQKTQAQYLQTKSKVEIKNFFDDIENLLHKCDLVIARAGAATVMEVIAARKPSIFIPFAAAQDNHQLFNAKFLADQQAAIIIEEKDLTPEILSKQLLELITNKGKFSELQSAMKKIKNIDAAQAIVDLILSLVTKPSRVK